ncbi:glycoside hydrolase family 3 protein [Dothidotthia symphoricarpi CBS 119687]|uniref:beta-glucosidase n=1 Tax=Dothidotthia symphoricarpi CBS 119687 TaxID=1392245 RepID=A0A6A5ZZN7_9PLEO|nr:glycoside hydrolase family 3 protein [Dothidotthia symphoricarpi CBS 119687]KAF2124485.1 glycoside hydrolase family 3 protein [Dothidotthia symphoricarpi CBS 119687]
MAPRAASNKTQPYWDVSLSVDKRVEDLIQRMTIEEKVGQLFHTRIDTGVNDTLANTSVPLVQGLFMSHFNTGASITNASSFARWSNSLQDLAANTRLGIPITLSTDPRHAFTDNIGTGLPAGAFSQWPESLGLAALRSPEIVKDFANIARQEYLAVGIKSALHPQVDLATEPRWSRIAGTMGEDAHLTAKLVVAYIEGFTGQTFGHDSVTTVTKHFPGGGAIQNGEDSHFEYGQNATYPGNNFDYHLIPFEAAIKAGARQMMPYYSRPIGTQYEEVGFGFNKGIVTGLLREKMGFDGIVVSDWGLITDSLIRGEPFPARAWGVQNLTHIQRAEKILNAGCDQFGGETRTDLILQLVDNGTISEERIDVSVRKLLREKFLLGLFENPYVDPVAAGRIVGQSAFRKLGNDTQRRAFTLLSNDDNYLPLRTVPAATKFYIEGFNQTYLERRGLQVVATPAEADYALVRLQAPYEYRAGAFTSGFHAGSLAYNATEQARQAAIYEAVPTIVDIYLDRPAIIPEIIESAAAVMANFGSGPDALLDIVFGVDGASPQGKLPFDLPRSMAAVEASKEDVPFDTENPVFRFGHGLRYVDDC